MISLTFDLFFRSCLSMFCSPVANFGQQSLVYQVFELLNDFLVDIKSN